MFGGSIGSCEYTVDADDLLEIRKRLMDSFQLGYENLFIWKLKASYVREITINNCGAILLCVMAQINGLIDAKECVSPFEYCGIVT